MTQIFQPDFNSVFDAYYSHVYQYTRYRTGSRREAENLTTTAFEHAWAAWTHYNPHKASLSTWLFTIARNVIINHIDKESRRGDIVRLDEISRIPTGSLWPEDTPRQKEQFQQMLEQLSRLSPRDQDIIAMKFAGRLKNREIAQILEMNELTVKVVLLRALRKLKGQLEEVG